MGVGKCGPMDNEQCERVHKRGAHAWQVIEVMKEKELICCKPPVFTSLYSIHPPANLHTSRSPGASGIVSFGFLCSLIACHCHHFQMSLRCFDLEWFTTLVLESSVHNMCNKAVLIGADEEWSELLADKKGSAYYLLNLAASKTNECKNARNTNPTLLEDPKRNESSPSNAVP